MSKSSDPILMNGVLEFVKRVSSVVNAAFCNPGQALDMDRYSLEKYI